MRAGTSLELYAPPFSTATMASSIINVGTLNGDSLHTSVSDALTWLCPAPTSSGAFTDCQNSSATIDGVAYFDQGAADSEGGSSFCARQPCSKVPSSKDNNTELRDDMVAVIAMSTNSSDVGPSCSNETIGSSANTKGKKSATIPSCNVRLSF